MSHCIDFTRQIPHASFAEHQFNDARVARARTYSPVLLGVILRGSAEACAWQQLPSDLSDSPIQRKRFFSLQPRPDKPTAAEGDETLDRTINDLLAPKTIDSLPISNNVAVEPDTINQGGARPLQQMIDDEEKCSCRERSMFLL